MPQLLVFVPCEKVIISKDENNPTLIAVMQQVGAEFELIETTSKPTSDKEQSILLPMRWSIFTMWRAVAGDADKTFTQVIKVLSPDGKARLTHSGDFTLEKTTHRITLNIQSIPAAGSGTWMLQLFIHETGKPAPTVPIATYPLDVSIIDKTKPQDASAPA
jgi:hypothetical protein